MSISYPLSFPTVSGISHSSLSLKFVNGILVSPWTGQTQVQATEYETWLADLTLSIRSQSEAGPWRAFLAALRGVYGTFMLGDFSATSPQGSGLGTPVVDGASQTGYTLATRGWTASSTNVLLAGDYLQIGSRLYMCVEDVSSDGSGEASFDIRPQLRESPGDGSSLILENAKGIFRLTSDTAILTETYGDDLVYPVTFAAMEAL